MLKGEFNKKFLKFIQVLAGRFPSDASLHQLPIIVEQVIKADPQSDIFLDPFQQAIKPLLDRIRKQDESLLLKDEIKPFYVLHLPVLWPALPDAEKAALWVHIRQMTEHAMLIETVKPQMSQFEDLARTLDTELKQRGVDCREALATRNFMPVVTQLMAAFQTNPDIEKSLNGIAASFQQDKGMQDNVKQFFNFNLAGLEQPATAAGLDLAALNQGLDAAVTESKGEPRSRAAAQDDDGSDTDSESDSDSASISGDEGQTGSESESEEVEEDDGDQEDRPRRRQPAAAAAAAAAEPYVRESRHSRRQQAAAAASSGGAADDDREAKQDGEQKSAESPEFDKDAFMAACQQLESSGMLQTVLANMGVPLGPLPAAVQPSLTVD